MKKKSNLIPVILLKFNFFKKEELPSKKCGVGAFGLCLKLRARIMRARSLRSQK